MEENTTPKRPLYFELKYRDCPHTATIPLTRGANCKVHCFVYMPELREVRFRGRVLRAQSALAISVTSLT
jgi:hypothetical protein